jgi:SagB-type dehydrogenase family enzyme
MKMLELSFRRDISLKSPAENGMVHLEGQQFAWTAKKLSPGIKTALKMLAEGSVPESQLLERVTELDGPNGLIFLFQYLNRLSRLICYSLKWEDKTLATLIPHEPPSDYQFQEKLIDLEQQYVLSRFASFQRTREGEMVIESPLGRAKVVVHHAIGGMLFAVLGRPHRPRDLAAGIPDLPEAIGFAFANLLLNAQIICAVDAEIKTQEDTHPALGQWAYSDLLFHKETRMGWKDQPYGGNYRFRDQFEPLPLIKPDLPEMVIPLFEPDLSELMATDMPFTAVLEQRQSRRQYGEQPVSLEQLGEFLYRTARLKKVIDMGPGDAQLAFRPYPSGGALHELEIYPVIGSCQGLESGLYYYNALDHQLHQISGQTQHVDGLLTYAWLAANRESQPQVLFVITARFQRIQWKYQSLPYALILKHVGVLMQTMYLVATAMGLAPCALGGGNSDLFAQAAQLDYYAETSVGEFLLGSL